VPTIAAKIGIHVVAWTTTVS